MPPRAGATANKAKGGEPLAALPGDWRCQDSHPAVRLAPTEGEALDSWLEALAHRCDVRWRDIMAAVGLPAGRFGFFAPIVALDAAHRRGNDRRRDRRLRRRPWSR